jgi:murein L,D-transpeptidase YcbB/YkuD
MKRATMFVALASAFSFSIPAFAHGDARSQNQSEWSKATERVEAMNGQPSENPDLVKQAQEKLSHMGKDVGTADGQMNAKTEQALAQYQQEHGLQPTGQLDRQTLAALDLNHSGSAATGGASSH